MCYILVIDSIGLLCSVDIHLSLFMHACVVSLIGLPILLHNILS